MPISSIPTGSQRLLSLLSLLQVRRDWSGEQLSQRLEISARTVRRDVERLRELGYPVRALRGPAGGYRLDAGSQMPPLLFDDEQTVALAIALRSAPMVGAEIGEAADRALATLRQVMPSRLRSRLDAVEMATVPSPEHGDSPTSTAVLLAIGAAIRQREALRFDYRTPAADDSAEPTSAPPRQIDPHHLLARGGRWYVLGWEARREEWRIYRADRMTPRTPNGARFEPREVPGGDPAEFLETRFKGSDHVNAWPCQAEVVLHCPAQDVFPYARDGVVEVLGPERTRLQLGAWSWSGLAARLAQFDADIEVVQPPQLVTAFADLARRANRAATIGTS